MHSARGIPCEQAFDPGCRRDLSRSREMRCYMTLSRAAPVEPGPILGSQNSGKNGLFEPFQKTVGCRL